MKTDFTHEALADYVPPSAGVLEMAVESGFATSPDTGTFDVDSFTNGGEI